MNANVLTIDDMRGSNKCIVSFEELSDRELMKGWVWWVGLVVVVATVVEDYLE